MSCVMCHLSCIMWHVLHVTCHVSRVTFHMSHVTFFFGQSGETYRWWVCYQRGLPRLVYIASYYRHIVYTALSILVCMIQTELSYPVRDKKRWEMGEGEGSVTWNLKVWIHFLHHCTHKKIRRGSSLLPPYLGKSILNWWKWDNSLFNPFLPRYVTRDTWHMTRNHKQ